MLYKGYEQPTHVFKNDSWTPIKKDVKKLLDNMFILKAAFDATEDVEIAVIPKSNSNRKSRPKSRKGRSRSDSSSGFENRNARRKAPKQIGFSS